MLGSCRRLHHVFALGVGGGAVHVHKHRTVCLYREQRLLAWLDFSRGRARSRQCGYGIIGFDKCIPSYVIFNCQNQRTVFSDIVA